MLSYPVGQLIFILVIAGSRGRRGDRPARRAARLDVLEALAYE